MDLVGSSTGALSPVRPKEGGMVVFDMPNVTSIRVAKFEVRQGGAVYFLVEVVLEGDSCWQWSVEKTFEQFVALHKTLVEKHGVQQDLFPSVGKKQIAQLKVKMINQLQSQLDRYLASVLEVLGLPPRELLDFLEYKYTDVISVTRSLASFAYEHGDMILKEDKVVQITPLQLYCIKRRMVLPVASSETGHMRDDFGNLIDFVQKLHRMKITSPPEHLSDVSISNIAFDLSLFKGLTVLGLEYVRPSQVAGMDSMARQLATLEVHHSIQALQDLLVQCPESDLPLSGLQWTHLTCANFAFNELEAIDASIVMLPSLTRLDLSYNAITKLDNLSELSHLEMVDLSYNCIRSLQGASHQLGHVKELRLSHNQISCLDGIEILTLECVDLSFNQISKEDELHHLTALTSLVELHLHDNPISISKAYKSHVMSRISTAVDRVKVVDSGVGGVDSGVGGVKSGVGGVDSGVGGVDSGVGGVDSGVGGVDSGVGGVDSGVGRVDSGVGGVDSGVGRVDSGVGGVDSGGGGVDSGVGGVDSGVGGVDSGVGGVDSGVGGVDSGVGVAGVGGVDSSVGGVNSGVTVVWVELTVVWVELTVVWVELTVVELTVVWVELTVVWVELTVVWVELTVVWVEFTVVWVELTVVWVELTVVWVELTVVWVELTLVWVELTVVWVELTVVWVELTAVWVELTVVWVELTVVWVELTVVWVELTAVWVELTVVWVELTVVWVELTLFLDGKEVSRGECEECTWKGGEGLEYLLRFRRKRETVPCSLQGEQRGEAGKL
ncbi:hypothetical protein EMCRGX_G000179 [Ephydatia muelleri]